VEVLILFCIVCGLHGIFTIALPVYFAKMQVKKVVCINRFSEWDHWCFLHLSSIFVLLTIMSGYLGELTIKDTVVLLLAQAALTFCGIDLVDHGFLPYCPAM
jgi:hypothetical protein